MQNFTRFITASLILLSLFSLSAFANTDLEATAKKSDKKSINFQLTDFAGNDIKKLKIGKKYRVEIEDSVRTDLFVYVNQIRVDSLIPLRNLPGFYSFVLLDKDMDGSEPLHKLLADEKLAEDDKKIHVRLGIGTSPRKLLYYKQNVAVDVFDGKREAGKFIILFAMITVSFVTMYILFKDKQRILRDTGTLGVLAPFSLARTQMAFWTIIILISVFWVWYDKGVFVEITTQVLVLIGISAGTSVTANLIDNADLKNAAITVRHQDKSSSKNILMNIVSDQNGLSIHRFQNVIFSMAVGCYFLFEVFTKSEIPQLNENLMVLMGISASTYLAIKKGENSTFQEEIKANETKAKKDEEAVGS